MSLIREAFVIFYEGNTLINLARNIKTWANSSNALYERWKRPNKGGMKALKVRSRTYHYEKATENNKFGPEWVLHGRRGARYGLFRGINDEYIPLNLKTRKVVAKAGTFKATESGLIWTKDLSSLDKIISGINESTQLNELHPDAPQMANKMMDRIQKYIDDYNNATDDKKKDALDRLKKAIGPIESGINSPEFDKLPDDIKNRANEILKKVKELESPASTNKGDKLEGPQQKPALLGHDTTDTEDESSEEEMTNLKKALPRYIKAIDPEKTNKAIQKAAGALFGAVTWMMKSENEKGGNSFEQFGNKLIDQYKSIKDDIKSGKVAAAEINKKVSDVRNKMIQLLSEYKKTKSDALKVVPPNLFNQAIEDNAQRRKFFEHGDSVIEQSMKASETMAYESVFGILAMKSKHASKFKKILSIVSNKKITEKIKEFDKFIKNNGIASELAEYMLNGDESKLIKDIDSAMP